MDESFNLFDDLASSEGESRLAVHKKERNLREAAYEVRQSFGKYLSNSSSRADYDERFSYLEDKISSVVSEKVTPTAEVMMWVKGELVPKAATDKYHPGDDDPDWDDEETKKRLKEQHKENSRPKTAGFVKRSEMDPWQWDDESKSFKSSKTSDFRCTCGCMLSGVGQHGCGCGNCDKIWNISSIVDGNKTASTPLYVCRQVMRRDTILAKVADGSGNALDPTNPVPPTNPTAPSFPGAAPSPSVPNPNDLLPTIPDANSDPSVGIQVPDAMSPAPVQETRAGKAASIVDPLHPKSNPVPTDEGYDVPNYFGPAAGDKTHDPHFDAKMKAFEDIHSAALQLIFAESEDGEEDFPETEEAPTPPAPEPASPMPIPSPAPVAAPPIENQPLENSALDVAQQAILDLILREKREDVMGVQDTEQKQEILQDAYQSLDTVQDIESAENMIPGPIMASVFRQGYFAGYLDRMADSYTDRKTDYVGTEPAIPGISNGLDDAITNPGFDGAQKTKELRNELGKELDEANGKKEERPLDPAEPFGKNKTTAGR